MALRFFSAFARVQMATWNEHRKVKEIFFSAKTSKGPYLCNEDLAEKMIADSIQEHISGRNLIPRPNGLPFKQYYKDHIHDLDGAYMQSLYAKFKGKGAPPKGRGKGPPPPPHSNGPKGGGKTTSRKRPSYSFRVTLTALKHVAAFQDLSLGNVQLKDEDWTELHTLFHKEELVAKM